MAKERRERVQVMDSKPLRYAASALLVVLPVALYLLWGGYLPDEAFVLLRQAQRLAEGGWGSSLSLEHPPLSEPLFLGLLTASEWLGLPSPAVAGLTAAAGWSVAIAVLVYLSGRVGPPLPFLAGALLLALSPLLISSSGSSSSWAVAVCLLLLAPSQEEPGWRQALLAVALVLIVLDPATLLVAALFLLWQWQQQRRLPWIPWSLLALIAFTWYGWQTAAAGSAALWAPPSAAGWLSTIRNLLRESEFYWLFLPALAGGLLTLLVPWLRPVSNRVYRGILLLLLGGAGGLLLGSRFALVLLPVLGLLLAGLASAGLLAWLQREERLALSPRLALIGLSLGVTLPLAAAETASLWQHYQFRPVAWQEMERDAAAWLAAESEPGSVLWASHRAAYYARRPLVAADDVARASDRPEGAPAHLLEEEPAYVLANSALSWDSVTHSSWFRIRYCPVYEDRSPAEPRSPLIVWQFQGEPAQGTAFGVRAAQGFELVDARIEPTRIEPGDAVTVRLSWKGICPLAGPFEMRLHLTTPLGGKPLLEEQFLVPQTIPFGEWQTGQTIEESYTFTTGTSLEAGAYPIRLSLNSPGSVGPAWSLYRLDDPEPVDRITLGHVVRPWQGDATGATPVAARFGEQIELESARLEGVAVPGSTLTLELFWRALRQPDDDSTIFVHLLDGQGQLVTGADREPLEGRFPTSTWQAGEYVGTEHPLQLPADLAPGSYRLVAGLYQRESGERLPLVSTEGTRLPDGVLPLPFAIEVP